MNRMFCGLMGVGLFLGVAGQAKAAQPSYAFSTIDVPGAAFTEAFGINSSGRIVGAYGNPDVHGFVLDDGSDTTMDVPGATRTEAVGINPSGQIVGTYVSTT